VLGEAATIGGGLGAVPWLLPNRHTDHGPGVPVAVWAVWDGEDLVGVYAQESTARADATVLQRDAALAGYRAGSVDCLPLQVFTEPQHPPVVAVDTAWTGCQVAVVRAPRQVAWPRCGHEWRPNRWTRPAVGWPRARLQRFQPDERFVGDSG